MMPETKVKLKIFIPLALVYFGFCYLPLEHWMGEIPYLVIRLVVFIAMAVALVLLKRKWELEIEVPQKQISLVWLIPLLVICFAHPLYALLFNMPVSSEIPWLELGIDATVDVFVSVTEDILFVDIYIGLLSELLIKHKYRMFKSIMIAATTFTLAHCYTFIHYEFAEALVIVISVFFVIIFCGYLAVYFDSPLIPIVYHLLFNECNFVLFHRIFEQEERTYQYVIWLCLIVFFTCWYIAALYHMSFTEKARPTKRYRKENEE